MNHEQVRQSQRAFVLRLLAEHRQLNRDLRSVTENLAAAAVACDEQCRAQIVQCLDGLRAALWQHFSDEEQGGCVEEAVSFLPQLAAEARQLEQQHSQLLNQLDELAALARDRSVGVLVLESDFAEFSRALMAHEALENRVVSRGFSLECDAEFADLFADESPGEGNNPLSAARPPLNPNQPNKPR